LVPRKNTRKDRGIDVVLGSPNTLSVGRETTETDKPKNGTRTTHQGNQGDHRTTFFAKRSIAAFGDGKKVNDVIKEKGACGQLGADSIGRGKPRGFDALV